MNPSSHREGMEGPFIGSVLMTTSVFPRWAGDATPPFVLNQAEWLARAGWRVTVLAPHASGAARRERWGQVDIIRFPYVWPAAWQGLFYEGGMLVQLRQHPRRKCQLPFLLAAQLATTRGLARSGRFDLVHAHSLLPQGLTALRKVSGHRLPVIATSHGNDVFGMSRGGLYGRLKRKVVREADALTANSSATERALLDLGADPERVHRIPSVANVSPPDPVRVAVIRAESGGGPLVLFVGRLIEEKGPGDLVKAFARIASKHPKARLLLLGEGPERQALQARVTALGLAAQIDLPGWVPREQLSSYFAAADIFCGPSKTGPGGWVEAQGLVFVEAMAAGTTVVATRCGGIPDMIRDGETGLLVEPGDVGALAGALERLLGDATRRAQLAERASRHYTMHFSPEVVAASQGELYQQVLPGARGGAGLSCGGQCS